ncbi:MAG: 30S ribosomal protein S15 [Planctomycetes bacterium]|nr:30S ribosomal protein S15 [Planctomycetota bacterium]
MTTPAIKSQQRSATIKEFARHETDSGSPQVQVALLTKRINHVNEHMKANKKDFGTQRGLLKMVGQRNRLLRYLKRTKLTEYQELIKSLGLRK